MIRISACVFSLLASVVLLSAPPKPLPAIKSPVPPAQSKSWIKIDPGLRLELVACEPAVQSPVAMEFDEDGRLWVVEMLDYPNGPPKGKPGESRIRLLEDKDGDGEFETSRVFADQLLFANGLMPWRGGVIVTAAPHILFLLDTDGDGKADHREVLFEGFAAENPQLRVNHPILGLDNWIYVSNGLRGGVVKRSGSNKKPVNISGMDFRFDLIGERYEAVSGMGQFGNTFDDWGRRFVCDNRHHLRHIVLPNRAIRRNPYLAVTDVLEDISELQDGPLNSGGKIYPLSKNWTTSNLHAGRFTAACGVFIYRGDALPQAYHGGAFTCDPTGNLVHHEILRPAGGTFRSKPARDKIEFLASPEDWFRPVYLTLGPDGAMYLVDMYRAVIEHPQFMPPELKKRPDLTLGKNRGRIWRIVPQKPAKRQYPRPQLSRARSEELVRLLDHPNAWWRTTAQRLIWERQDRKTLPALNKMLRSPKPIGRLHAAWLLASFNVISEKALVELLNDEHPRIRENAVQIAEPLLTKSKSVQQAVLRLADDPDAKVRFETALALGAWDDDRVIGALVKIATAGVADRWTRYAVATAVPTRSGKLIAALFENKTLYKSPAGQRLFAELAELTGARRDAGEIVSVLQIMEKPSPVAFAILGGLVKGMARRGTDWQDFLQGVAQTNPAVIKTTESLMQAAARIAADSEAALTARESAIDLLAHAPWEIARPALTRLLDAKEQRLRLAAVSSLAAHRQRDVAKILMADWRRYTPALRREVAQAMLRSVDRIEFLFDELEAGRVKPGDFDRILVRQLLRHRRPEIRERAKKLLSENVPADRKAVLEKYRDALKVKGDARRGRAVFEKNCAVCHHVAGIGVNVAPDISDTRTKTAEALLIDILNPNQAIDNNYVNYLVTTTAGKVVTGIIAAETASSITLRRAENKTDVILKKDIEEMESTGQSLMPEGLEKNISIEQMADLLAFLKNWRYLEGNVPIGR
ncbi:MAG: cytochrome c [Gemmatales bacterium]|nr:MAG: cytochrome c [Gemmatales bacterium]